MQRSTGNVPLSARLAELYLIVQSATRKGSPLPNAVEAMLQPIKTGSQP